MFHFYCSFLRLFFNLMVCVVLIVVPNLGFSQLSLNVFPPDETIDFDEPGVNGFDIDYRLFGSQSGAGAASATIEYYYCDNASGSGTCYFIDSRQVLLNCNSGSTLCFPQNGLQTHYISRISLPSGFLTTCFPGDWYIIGQVIGNSGSSLNTNPTDPVIFASSRPDIEPLAIDVTPNPEVPGQMLISSTVVNNGPCPSPALQATVWLTPDAGAPILFDVPALNSGSGVIVTVSIENLEIGVCYDATLTVDVFDGSLETDESNNALVVEDVFKIPTPMEIENFSPAAAVVGSLLTINGSNGLTPQGDFLDVQKVFLGGVEAPILFAGENVLQVAVPYFVNTDFIMLQTLYGTTVVSENEFVILCSPDAADIEDGSLPFPWAIENPDEDQSFGLYNNGANGSTRSIVMNHWTYTNLGALDFIIIPHVCVDNISEWYLQFDVAYTYYVNGSETFIDNLIIADYSTGDLLEVIGGEDLATVPPQAALFEPTASDWVTREIPLVDLIDAGQTELYIALVTQNGNGNAMYLDNIRVSNSSILPVEYASIKAKTTDNAIEVHWSTATESNNELFIVESSIDGILFEEIGRIPGANNSSQLQSYLFTDNTPAIGLNYYRILQVDFDGRQSHSDIVSAVYYKEDADIKIGPNPGSGQLYVYTDEITDEFFIKISDASGRQVRRIDRFSGSYLDLSDLPNGIYLLEISDGRKSHSFTYLKE